MLDVANLVYRNEETGYSARVEDSADLLTEEEEADLIEVMKGITSYGNVAFKSAYAYTEFTEKYAREYYKSVFGTDSGTLFLIDMRNRMLWIHSDGAIYKSITKDMAEVITDNVYREASKENYYACASKAFRQIKSILDGEKIAKPMKYISNALWAMVLAMLVNFGLICYLANTKGSKKSKILEDGHKMFDYTTPETTYIKESKNYHAPSNYYNDPSRGSSGGGFRGGGGFHGGGGGGFGGGGGGGRSGGGGGHRF